MCLQKEEEKREVAKIQALERDPLRVDEHYLYLIMMHDRKGKQAEQEVYFLYTEEEERIRVDAEEKLIKEELDSALPSITY